VKEAFNTLCANLLFATDDAKAIMVTSCFPQEGKSSVSFEMVRTIGEMGRRVVLLDADIRASCLMEDYDIKVEQASKKPLLGLSRYLAGGCGIEDIICSTNLKNVSMILSGRNVVNSLPLLSGERLGELIDVLKDNFDVIIIDTPPIGTIIDAAKIARHCDGVLFVVKSGEVRKKDLADAMRQLERTGCPIFGTVLNGYAGDKRMGKDYYSSYYNMMDDGEKPRKSKGK